MKPTSHPSRSSHKAFTLIELLVVIAIIAILASILFPVFGRARENARRTTCQSNMKQVGLAFTQYAQDYDEILPFARTYGTYAVNWDLLIEPYAQKSGNGTYGTGNQPYLVCPSDTIDRKLATQSFYGNNKRSYAVPGNSPGFGYGGIDKSYIWKTSVADPSVPGNGYMPGRRLSDFPSVSGTLELVEAPLDVNKVGENSGYAVFSPSGVGSSSSYSFYQDGAGAGSTGINGNAGKNLTGSHFDGWNYLFIDGHVKWLKPLATVGKTTPAPGYGTNADGYYCTATLSRPCGMWTIADDDDK